MTIFNRFAKDDDVIFHGDAVFVLSSIIPDHSVDLIFADPPYNIGKQFSKFHDKWDSDEDYAEWCYQWLTLCINKLKPAGSLYVMSSTQAMPYIDLFLRQRIHILSRLIWHYDSSGVQARNRFGSLYEPILHCVRDVDNYTFNTDDIMIEAKTGAQRKLIDYRKKVPKLYNTKKVPGNSWYFPRVRYRMNEYEEHPSQKPEALLERIILVSSHPGDVVLDPFAGTFTTSAVAQRLGRQTLAIELQEEYVRIGLRRLGIQNDYNGVKLTPPAKSYRRESKDIASEHQPSLFEEFDTE